MEKLYLVHEDRIIDIERHEDSTIEELSSAGAIEFNNMDKLLKFLIQQRLEDDGQLFRFITDFIDEFITDVSEEVFLNNEYPDVDTDIFSTADICSMIIKRCKELAIHHRAKEKKELKEFDK